MADQDEDPMEMSSPGKVEFEIPSIAENSGQADPESRITVDEHEDEDEQMYDYRFLASLAQRSRSSKDTPLLPRRGEKDFEPHGTIAQSSVLQASQAAMHDALSHERVHGPGLFDLAESLVDDPDTSQDASASYMKTLASKSIHLIGFFDADTALTFIPRQHGVWFRTIGRAVKRDGLGVFLEPEEALWMCERGSLDLRFGSRLEDYDHGEGEDDSALSSLQGLPMSVQAAYACFIGARGLTLERYLVYSGLKRAGYTVFRAPGAWEEEDDEEKKQSRMAGEDVTSIPITLRTWFQVILNNVSSSMSTKSRPGQPLIGTGFFRDYATIYNRLSIIPSHISNPPHIPASAEYPALSPTYHAYPPSTPIRKSQLPPPELYITVLDARENDFPTATQLTDLIAKVAQSSKTTASSLAAAPNSKPATNTKSATNSKSVTNSKPAANSKPDPNLNSQSQSQTTPQQARPPSLYARLKAGKAGHKVILAVVDCGVTSYMRVSEGVFANEHIWKTRTSSSTSGKGGKVSFGQSRTGGRG